MRRRDFIAGVACAAALPAFAPLATRAQQRERMPRIGVLMPYNENDPVAKTYVPAFTKALVDFGWTDGGNVRMVVRWAGVTSIG